MFFTGEAFFATAPLFPPPFFLFVFLFLSSSLMMLACSLVILPVWAADGGGFSNLANLAFLTSAAFSGSTGALAPPPPFLPFFFPFDLPVSAWSQLSCPPQTRTCAWNAACRPAPTAKTPASGATAAEGSESEDTSSPHLVQREAGSPQSPRAS